MATLTLTPNPAHVGDWVALAGSGYLFEVAHVEVHQPDGSLQSFYVGMWSGGTLDTARFLVLQAGAYRVEVYQVVKGKKEKLEAAADLAGV